MEIGPFTGEFVWVVQVPVERYRPANTLAAAGIDRLAGAAVDRNSRQITGRLIDEPAEGVGALCPLIALVIDETAKNPEGLVGSGVAGQQRAGRCRLTGFTIILAAQTAGHKEAPVIGGACGAQIDGRADAALLEFCQRRLVNVRARDQLRRKNVEAELATHVIGGKYASVQEDSIEFRAETANRDEPTLALIAIDRHAGYALQ